jgi:co-chaperonin GroES (HSP10)
MSNVPHVDPRTSKYQQPHNLQGERPEGEDLVADTWERLGRKMTVMRDFVLIRTDKPITRTASGIFLTDKESSFYQGLPNVDVPGRMTAYKWATVVTVGKDVYCVKPGDRVVFPRGHFVRHSTLDDKSLVGMIREPHLWAVEENSNAEGNP